MIIQPIVYFFESKFEPETEQLVRIPRSGKHELRIIPETAFEKEWMERFQWQGGDLKIKMEGTQIGTHVIVVYKEEGR